MSSGQQVSGGTQRSRLERPAPRPTASKAGKVRVSLVPSDDSGTGESAEQGHHNDLVRAYLDVVSLSDGLQARVWRDAELTLAQLRMLRRLSRRSMTVGQLGQALSLSSTSVTKMLDRLEVRSLIQRQRDEKDRRRVEIVLLPAGRELLTVLPIPADSAIHTAVDAMPQDRQVTITKAMREFASAVRQHQARRDVSALLPGKR
jgi:DNA-binding MarR family transcriptional regulator